MNTVINFPGMYNHVKFNCTNKRSVGEGSYKDEST